MATFKTFLGLDNPDDDPNNDRGLKTLAFIMFFGLLAILCISIFTAFAPDKKNSFWPVLGLSFIISLATTICGGFMGFLFGIPRSLQKTSTDIAADNLSLNEKAYANNTNLEQISDWLTKIIVGVSLTQLPAIETRFDNLCTRITNGFSGYLSKEFGYPYSACLIVFFSICGFLFVYLWAKIYLRKQLLMNENELDRALDRQKKEIINTVNTIQDKQKKDIINTVSIIQDKQKKITDAENEIEEFNKTKNRIVNQESQPDLKRILDVAKPNPVTMVNDCQKNRWSGQSTSGAYSATATFEKENDTDENYLVTIIASTSDPEKSPITGTVYFFLHDTFYPRNIAKETAENNKAKTTIGSYEAFTVGIVLNEGAVKLELDLNLLANAPDDYKYSDELYSIDQAKQKLEELKKQRDADNQEE